MPHEVVNSPETGAVTWCGGIGCPRCDAERELNERIRRGETVRVGESLGVATMPPYQIIEIG